MRFWRGSSITSLKQGQVFVFGSNPEGRHGAGAAKAAMKFGARYGIGVGLMGNSYGIVTKNLRAGSKCRVTGKVYNKTGYQSLTLEEIREQVQWMYTVANQHPQLDFLITYQITNKRSLCGYYTQELLEHCFFKDVVPWNVVFHESIVPLMCKSIDIEYID